MTEVSPQVEQVTPVRQEAPQINLLGMGADELASLVGSWGDKPFRAKQLMRWIHQRGADDFGQMTDLAKAFRDKLVAAGKLKLVALVATARKLVTILNAILRDRQPWRDQTA